MHQPGAILNGDIVGQDDEVSVGRGGTSINRRPLSFRPLQEVVRALVGPKFHLRAHEGLAGKAPPLTQHFFEQRLGNDEVLGGRICWGRSGDGVGALRNRVLVDDDVTHLGVDGHGSIRDEGPRGGRPHQKLGASRQRARRHRESHIDRRVVVILVTLG